MIQSSLIKTTMGWIPAKWTLLRPLGRIIITERIWYHRQELWPSSAKDVVDEEVWARMFKMRPLRWNHRSGVTFVKAKEQLLCSLILCQMAKVVLPKREEKAKMLMTNWVNNQERNLNISKSSFHLFFRVMMKLKVHARTLKCKVATWPNLIVFRLHRHNLLATRNVFSKSKRFCFQIELRLRKTIQAEWLKEKLPMWLLKFQCQKFYTDSRKPSPITYLDDLNKLVNFTVFK